MRHAVESPSCLTDALSSGRRFHTLNIVDDYTRECLADTSLGGQRVVRVLEELKQQRGLPRQIRSDNRPEFLRRRPRTPRLTRAPSSPQAAALNPYE